MEAVLAADSLTVVARVWGICAKVAGTAYSNSAVNREAAEAADMHQAACPPARG